MGGGEGVELELAEAEGLPVGVDRGDLASEDGAGGGLEEGDELDGGGGAGDVVDADGGALGGGGGAGLAHIDADACRREKRTLGGFLCESN